MNIEYENNFVEFLVGGESSIYEFITNRIRRLYNSF
jgi:hypothetical protein